MGKRALLVLELIICFGPSVMILFLGPIAALLAAGNSPIVGLKMVLWCALGVVGMLAVLNLAAHEFDRDHALPSRTALYIGCSCGAIACVSGIIAFDHPPWALPVFVLPIVATVHLLYRCRREMGV